MMKKYFVMFLIALMTVSMSVCAAAESTAFVSEPQIQFSDEELDALADLLTERIVQMQEEAQAPEAQDAEQTEEAKTDEAGKRSVSGKGFARIRRNSEASEAIEEAEDDPAERPAMKNKLGGNAKNFGRRNHWNPMNRKPGLRRGGWMPAKRSFRKAND